MSDKELNWKFSEDFVVESAELLLARQHSLEQGVEPVSPATGAHLAILAAATAAASIVEIGTGLGVSGLWLLSGSPAAVLTSIDSELDYQLSAKKSFTDAGIASNRVRLITGRALEVLPRMNEGSYDLVLVDADPHSVIAYVEHGLRLARVGGVVAIAHALLGGRVSDPAQRDSHVADYRAVLREVSTSAAVICSLLPIGDGLLLVTKTS